MLGIQKLLSCACSATGGANTLVVRIHVRGAVMDLAESTTLPRCLALLTRGPSVSTRVQ